MSPARALRSAAAVVGVGSTPIGTFPQYTADDLGGWALSRALADAGIDAGAIDGVLVSRVSGYQAMLANHGMEPTWLVEMPSHGRMASASIQLAAQALAAGACTTVALIYGNNGRSAGASYGGKGEGYGTTQQLNLPYGMTSPGAFYAMMLRRHMHEFGTTSDQLAEVSMTMRYHASLNPNAARRELFDRNEYHASRYIVDPMHIYDYCIINDGAVALIMTTADRAGDHPEKPVFVRGFGQQGSFLESEYPPDDFWQPAVRKAGDEAYRMAGVDRSDVKALMIYDNFAPNVLFALEGLGFCEQGEGGSWVQDGRIRLGGELPVNTSGGHLSESYMQGWALNAEAVRQVRGECGDRQVPDADVVQYLCSTPLATTIVYGSEA